MDDNVITLLRRTLDITADEIDEADVPQVWSPHHTPHQSPRWRALTLVACVALVAAGVVVVASRAGDPNDASRGADTVVPADSEPGWYLPTYLPDGYRLTGLKGSVEPGVAGIRSEIWVRKEDGRTTGRIAAWVNLPMYPPTVEQPAGTDVAVHGVAGEVTALGASVDSSRDDWNVEWSMNGNRFSITTTGVGDDATVALAHASSVTGDVLTLDPESLPEGFVLVESRQYNGSETYEHLLLVVGPAQLENSGAVFVDVASAASPLDALVSRESERRTVHGVEFSILVEAAPTSAEHTTITWIRDGRRFMAFGRIGVDELLKLAAGMQPATPDDALDAYDDVQKAAMRMPELASATMPDGRVASVRVAGGSERPQAFCLTDATPACFGLYFDVNESGGPVSGFYRVFDAGGQQRVVGWHLENPGDITSSDGSPVDVVEGTSGWFVTLTVTDGAPLPSLDFESGGSFVTDRNWP